MSEIKKFNPENNDSSADSLKVDDSLEARTLGHKDALESLTESRHSFDLKMVKEIADELGDRHDHLVRMEKLLQDGKNISPIDLYNMDVELSTYELYSEYLKLVDSVSKEQDDIRVNNLIHEMNRKLEEKIKKEAEEYLEYQKRVLELRYLEPFQEITKQHQNFMGVKDIRNRALISLLEEKIEKEHKRDLNGRYTDETYAAKNSYLKGTDLLLNSGWVYLEGPKLYTNMIFDEAMKKIQDALLEKKISIEVYESILKSLLNNAEDEVKKMYQQT